MPRPTAAQLLERLRAIYESREGEALSDERLAARLPISLSTLNRWKKGDTRQFREIVQALDEAGWLSIGEDAPAKEATPPDPLERIGAALVVLARNQALALDALDVPEADRAQLPPQTAPRRARPKQK